VINKLAVESTEFFTKDLLFILNFFYGKIPSLIFLINVLLVGK